MDRTAKTILILSITGFLLLLGCIFDQPQAKGIGFAMKDRDYQMITVPVVGGNDALYIIDNRSGKMVVFNYNNNMKRLQPVAGRELMDAFK